VGEELSGSDGILVKRITIRKGDTLTDIAKMHCGKGSYFPQILVFNNIVNPDLIFPGDVLNVPIKKSKALPYKKNSRKAAQKAPAAKADASEGKRETVSLELDELNSYQDARRKFLAGEYLQAISALDSFLKKYPLSPLAADAALYRADSFLHLAESN
jgi:TolA-binding protein